MGCGESKHDVATGNTLTKKKSNVDSKKISKDIQKVGVVNNTTTTPPAVVQQPEVNQHLLETNSADNVQDKEGASVKDIAENTELKKEETSFTEANKDEKKDGVVPLQGRLEPGRLLISRDSPNHYFSSRKDEEAAESIVSETKSEYDTPRHDNGKEGVSALKTSELIIDASEEKKSDDKSEYQTPRHDNGKEEELLKTNETLVIADDAAKEKKSDDIVEKKLVEEAKPEEKAVPVNIKEENHVKEAEEVQTVSTTSGEDQKNVTAGEGHMTQSTTEGSDDKSKEKV